MPTFKQARYFVAVAEAGSIRKAADRLEVAQPTVSIQLNALEKRLGVVLFERSRTASRLTPSGRQLLPVAQELVSQVHQFEALAHSLSDDAATTLRLGVPPTLGPYLLPHIMPTMHERYSRLKLHIREDVPKDLVRGLLEGRHDFILTPLPLQSELLAWEVLFREPLWLIAPRDMDIGDGSTVTAEDLAGREVLSVGARHALHQEVRNICERTGARLNRHYEGTSLDTVRQMVVMGMGIAFLPALYVQSEIHRPEELKVLRFSGGAPYREHALAYRPTSPSRSLFREFATLIRDLMSKENDAVIAVDARRT